MTNVQRFRRAVLLAAAICLLGPRAHALDPLTALTEFSLMNWPESAGPFPFGVYAITQDHDGYLWLGTRTGLMRFDGTNFTLWRGDPSLPEDRISVLTTASDGSLWLGFGTVGGVTRIEQGRVTNFDERDGLAPGDVNALLETRDGAIWVGTFSGLSRYQNNRWERFGSGAGLPTEPVLSLVQDRRGTLWVGTSAGVFSRGAGANLFEHASPLTVTDFAEDSSGVIWVADAQTGFRPLDSSARSDWNNAALINTPGRALLSDRSGSLWLGTRSDGVLRVHRGKDGAESSVERLTRREGLQSDEIRTLFEDRDGTVWIGTRMGLSRLSERSVRAASTGPEDDAYVYAVSRTADGSVWTATASGLWREAGGERQRYGVGQGLPGPIATALHEDGQGTLWVATTQGIAYFKGQRFATLPLPQSMIPAQVRSIATDQSGALWISDSLKGLLRWSDGALKRVSDEAQDGPPYVVYTDRADRVWVGFWSGGVTMYQGDRVAHYSSRDGLPAGTINVIYQDQRGALWVGTSKGLTRFDAGRFITFTEHGFPESTVVSITEDQAGQLWFGLGSGLLQMDPREFEKAEANPPGHLRYNHYGSEDGLPGTLGRPGTPSATRGGDGRLWFTTSVGLAVVDPSRLRQRPTPGPLRIEAVAIDGRPITPAPGLRLPPRTSRVEIDYSILNLAGAPRLRSRYRLDGFDSDWQDAGESRQASYTNLPPGSYGFRVVSTNSDGSWNDSGAVFDFYVEPAFYQTKAFYGGMALLAFVAVGSLWRQRLRHVRREYDLVLTERARVAREIHDTLLQSLVGVALEFDDISDQLDPSAQPLKNQVSRIREQVEHYIRETRQSIWDLRSPTLETTDLVTALRDFGNAAAAGSGVAFEVVIAGRPRRLAASVEEQLLRIGQEAITNAIRHASATLIRMEVSYEAGSVRLRVLDDGLGFDPDRIIRIHGAHWGLTNMQERAEQVDARFAVTSNPGAGTVIDVVVPLSSKVVA